MSNHSLTRNDINEPVCQCGFRPDVLDRFLMTLARRQLHAKNIVLNHAAGLNEYEERLGALAAPAPMPALTTTLRSPNAPFKDTSETEYPRAGVRPMPDGRWLLTLWDSPGVMHAWQDPEDATHPNMLSALETGWLIIGSHRQSGTRLNGMAAA